MRLETVTTSDSSQVAAIRQEAVIDHFETSAASRLQHDSEIDKFDKMLIAVAGYWIY